MRRVSKASYSDGVYEPSGKDRPNPFDISRAAHQGETGISYRGRTAMLVYFGQQLVEEIMDAQTPGCPVEFFNIKVPPNHVLNPEGKSDLEMPLRRTRYDTTTGHSPNNPRQQLSEITPFLDGQLIYGPAKAWTDAIREFRGGRLLGTNPAEIMMDFPVDNNIRLPFANPPVTKDHQLKPVRRFYRLGNPRGHENPFLLAFGVLWFRWHNYQARRILLQNNWDPVKDDEKIFNRARAIVIAQYQKIVFYDWLPLWLHIDDTFNTWDFWSKYPYKGYDPSVHPGITHEFQAAAMRFGHTLVPHGLWIRDRDCRYRRVSGSSPDDKRVYAAMRLCNTFWNSKELIERDNIESYIRGLTNTLAAREDSVIVTDLTDSVFGPLEFSRRDLAALNIQRGRDHGVADYNTVRKAFRMKPKETFESINVEYNKEEIRRLKALYGNTSAPDNLDLFTGGMLETLPDGPGELFREILIDQFIRIRNGDRFWFENNETSSLSETELLEIKTTTMHTIILVVANIDSEEIQKNVFILRPLDDGHCHMQPQELKPGTFYEGFPLLENCTSVKRYDYFSDSEAAFVLTFIFLVLLVIATIILMIMLARRRRQNIYRIGPVPELRTHSAEHNKFHVNEWVGPNEMDRMVTTILEEKEHRISVLDHTGMAVRFIDLRGMMRRGIDKMEVYFSSDNMEELLSLKIPDEHDLVIRFRNKSERTQFAVILERMLQAQSITLKGRSLVEAYILRNSTTKKDRQAELNKYFKSVCLKSFWKDSSDYMDDFKSESVSEKIIQVHLTQTEFAEAFGLKPSSIFIKHMFLLVDTERNGHVSFRDFMKIFLLFASNDLDQKVRILFNMYDASQKRALSNDDIHEMIRSLVDLSDSGVETGTIEEFVSSMYSSLGLRQGSDMTFSDFKKVFSRREYISTLQRAHLQLEGSSASSNPSGEPQYSKNYQRRMTIIREYSNTATNLNPFSPRITSIIGDNADNSLLNTRKRMGLLSELHHPRTKLLERWDDVKAFLETFRLEVFWMSMYILILLGLFLERAHGYYVLREHAGLRRIAGYGVSFTRGAASAMSFTYATLLLTMCRNCITRLRETFLHRFFPFDSLHSAHKIVAYISLVLTVIHIIGHGFNFYHISTHASMDMNCYFREYFRATHELATFQYWAFKTITGFTGILLCVVVIIMYVFASAYARRYLFKAFWRTHKLFIPVYLLTFFHGSMQLIQSPDFPWFVIGPAVLYIIDDVISLNRSKVQIRILKAELLPSDVTALIVKKPPGFEYKSGQWVRVACPSLGQGEFHPFTLTSAPHQMHLSLHIRTVGPWTRNLRRLFDPSNLHDREMPFLLMDGPFGEGHQDWYRYEVAVLIGGGIGVTPYASILQDIVHKTSLGSSVFCKKVYFLWVTRTQKQFEWMTDIIREVESDCNDLVDVQIFVTEFRRRFDLRTTMLYICERHFQKVAGKSLFTGLKATTHFGRPRFYDFLEALRYSHQKVEKIGVFSCGPVPMTHSVNQACKELNRFSRPTYVHHFENF
ncbi:hypothetical protein ACJMK2_043248 [Sinanodonta woodiana]|uniref:NAD(P)H oxidase (H2O2-forming) n=1 Tax=Sinanodonta woodiana TaxID=1069815 RepID=A0ABD3VZX4_SINWO